MTTHRFDKILVAIRGEAASHVIRTAQSMGIETVAVFSGAERNSPYVYLADEAWSLDEVSTSGDEVPSPSFPNISREKILAIAQASGAQAIHPGCGKLANDLEFSERCSHNDLIYIGSTSVSIELLQSKTVTRFVVEDAQVPLAPGYHGSEQSLPTLLAKAEGIGFPLLIRGDFPDGGAATRIVENAESLPSAVASAQDALKNQGAKQRLLLERLVPDARFVDIPVFIDQHGNGIHFPERDCSVRHQHQAVILESPTSSLPERVRKTLGEAALRCARTLQCVGGVTVSFVLDSHDGFYFSSLKPFIDVDSQLTSLVTGQNLVEWQLRIAAGEPLPCAQSTLVRIGHGFEANLYAGSPCEDQPAASTPEEPQQIRLWHRPEQVFQVQLNELHQAGSPAVATGARIGRLYAWDQARPQALRRLRSALKATAACGIATNLDYIHRTCSLPAYAEALVTSQFPHQHHAELCAPCPPPSNSVIYMAAIAWLAQEEISQIHQTDPREDQVTDLVAPNCKQIPLTLTHNSIRYSLTLDCMSDGFRIQQPQVDLYLRARYHKDTLVLDLGSHTEKAKVFSDSGIAIVYKNGSSYWFTIANNTTKQATP